MASAAARPSSQPSGSGGAPAGVLAAAGGAAVAAGGMGSFTEVVNYANGQSALRFNADGSGFAYYPTDDGSDPRVACCVSRVNEYQNKFFFYDNSSTTTRSSSKVFVIPKTLLCSVDERVVGSATVRGKPSDLSHPAKFLMTADGATVVDGRNNIKKQWLWDSSRQNAGTPPTEPIELRLNRYLTFKFIDRRNIVVTFRCESVMREFQCGERFRRAASVRVGELRGKRDIPVTGPTLRQRQLELATTQRQALTMLKPDSRRIQNKEISAVIATLEQDFASYEKRIETGEWKTSASAVPGWRQEALSQTLCEVPFFGQSQTDLGKTLPLAAPAGSERPPSPDARAKSAMSMTSALGATSGFGDTLSRTVGFAQGTLHGVTREGDKVLDEFQIRQKLNKRHPVLPRPPVLRNASGRYCIDAPAENPPPAFRPLEVVSSKQFDRFLATATPEQVVLIACLRQDEPMCRVANQVLDHVNGTLALEYSSPEQAPYVLAKFDMAESRYMVKRFGVQTLPMFLMFMNSKLVYAGTMGGAVVKVPLLNRAVNFLLVEPDPRNQLRSEQVIRREALDWDLGITPSDALAHVNRLAESAVKAARSDAIGDGPTGFHCVVFLNATMNPDDIKALLAGIGRRLPREKLANRGTLEGARLLGSSLVVVTQPTGSVPPLSVLCSLCREASTLNAHKGEERTTATGCCVRCGLVENPTPDLLLRGAGTVAAVLPIKSSTIQNLCTLWRQLSTPDSKQSDDGAHFGITHDDVLARLEQAKEAGKRGQFIKPGTSFGLSLSTVETKYRGVPLVQAPAS